MPTTIPTTTVEQQVTTTAPTTATIASTIECSSNSDCGQQVEKAVCYNGDVFMQRITPLCKKAGTPESNCIQKQSGVVALWLASQHQSKTATQVARTVNVFDVS